jgi:hypothetical protein
VPSGVTLVYGAWTEMPLLLVALAPPAGIVGVGVVGVVVVVCIGCIGCIGCICP